MDDEVERVYAVSRSEVLRGKGFDVPDIYQSILEFKTGVIATIENHWIAPDTNPSLNDIKVNILGSKGMINLDLTQNQLMERYLETASDRPDCLVAPLVRYKHVGFAHESIRDFVNCLAKGIPVQASLEDGIRVTKVILAILESATHRKPVDVAY